ncbi:uncharacterized protein LOC129695158 isoform X4 [Leucoraja erinacea]|uniref:uncharacterized protein LOC129695158 isoform X4 n=1 Tax=Leucoraja erinaceus TaxID=7782 RepID=UPI0024577023|nr:uncharacterized protein LOC129695158 isoform X4 [Leucoraja erinacea]
MARIHSLVMLLCGLLGDRVTSMSMMYGTNTYNTAYGTDRKSDYDSYGPAYGTDSKSDYDSYGPGYDSYGPAYGTDSKSDYDSYGPAYGTDSKSDYDSYGQDYGTDSKSDYDCYGQGKNSMDVMCSLGLFTALCQLNLWRISLLPVQWS